MGGGTGRRHRPVRTPAGTGRAQPGLRLGDPLGRLRIAGALLVAPSDTDAPSYPGCTTGFQPMRLERLPFPSIVIASTDDPYVSPERARQFATAWGSDYTEIGNAGHINGDAGYGPWPEGEKLLLDLCKKAQR